MLIKRICLILLFIVSFSTSFTHSMPLEGFDPNMSEEELMNQLMAEINAAIPEDQREAFWADVAKETERLEHETAHMAPEEKEQYLYNLIANETGAQELPTPTEAVVETAPVAIDKVQEIQKPKVYVDKTEEIIALITRIIKSIESFITKAGSFADFDRKVSNWIDKGRVTDWKSDGWFDFLYELNKLIHMLARFKEKDIKIGFKHINELGQHEAALQSLKQLQAKLQDYEPVISITPFEIASMSEKTKNACINVINALTDFIYRSSTPIELQKVIEKFDPVAKKLREEEERLQKASLSNKKGGVSSRPTRIAGKAPREEFNLPKFDDTDFGGLGGADKGYFGSRWPSQFDEHGDDKTGKDASSGTGSQGGASGGADGKQSKETDKALDDAAKKKKEEESKKPKEIKHPEIKKNVDDLLRKDIEEAHNAILETPEFQSKESLKRHISTDNTNVGA